MRTVEYRRPWTYAKQRDAIFCPERYGLTEASTKSGKTVGCIIWLFERAIEGHSGQHFWWVAPVSGQAEIAFRRFKQYVPRNLYRTNEADNYMVLANGTYIWFKSADKPDSLYGEDVYAAVIDEASRCKEDAWHAIRSTLTYTRGPVRIIGNVKGRKNWAYRLARQAEGGAENMHYSKLTAYDAVDAGVLDAAEIEDAKRTLPEDIFRQLYLAEPAGDEGNPFGIEAINACMEPLDGGPVVVWGWDLARSVDYTVGIGLSRRGYVAQFERIQKPWNITKQFIVDRVEIGTPAYIDASGVGDPIVSDLQLTGGEYHPYKFTLTSKQDLMRGLAAAIQQKAVRFPEGVIVRELESFEYVMKPNGNCLYSAPEGYHDDCVVALALAVHGFKKQAWDVGEIGMITAPSYWRG